MLCRDPYVKAGSAHPCGRCQPCLRNKKKMWSHRIMLERSLHRDNSFVTLTYSDEHIRNPNVGGTLAPEDTRDWLKRLRFSVRPNKLRYYLVGEYGDQSGRPHYHAALFGYPGCRVGGTSYSGQSEPQCCDRCREIHLSWGFGRVDVANLEIKSAQYIAGYITKKMTRFDDPRLRGRHPEFARMSLKPGIGADALFDVASVLLQYDVVDLQGDVPSSLQLGRRSYPLGRYLRGKLREYVGMDKKAPEVTIQKARDELLLLLYDSGVDPSNLPPEVRNQVVKNLLVEAGNQKVLNTETRLEIFKQRKVL